MNRDAEAASLRSRLAPGSGRAATPPLSEAPQRHALGDDWSTQSVVNDLQPPNFRLGGDIVGEGLRGGEPLDQSTRRTMELKFGRDFRSVRIHKDQRAAESARAVEATAFTFGNDIVFGAGKFAPRTNDGRRLIAHELAHVVEQTQAGDGKRVIQRQSIFTQSSFDPLDQGSRSWMKKTLAETDAPIRKWLDANINDVKILSLNAVVRRVYRNVLEAAGMSSGGVAAAISGWAADRGVVLPPISAVPGADETIPAAPLAKTPPGKFSPFSLGMVGLHIDINPTSEPEIAKALQPFRDRGIQVDGKLIDDITRNRDAGIKEMETFLQGLGLKGDAHKAAEFLADKLLQQSTTASAQAQQPTPSESAQAEGQKISEGVFGQQPPSLVKSTPVGVSITFHF
jgi:hypothetical protein